jgi:hypothetical protein
LQNVKRVFFAVAGLSLVLAGPASAARIAQADREAINRTVDAFVNTAVKRQNEDASWNLVTPGFRYGVSRSAWDKGNIPVYPYPARGTTFHSWTVDSASPTDVTFELMVPSRLSKTDSIQFQGEVKKIRGRWLVNAFNPDRASRRSLRRGPRDRAGLVSPRLGPEPPGVPARGPPAARADCRQAGRFRASVCSERTQRGRRLAPTSPR